jgi:hypothetical protein
MSRPIVVELVIRPGESYYGLQTELFGKIRPMGWVFLLFLALAVAFVVGAIVFRARLINSFFQLTTPERTTSTQRAFTIKPPEQDDVFQCGPYKSVLARRWVMIWDYKDKAGRLHSGIAESYEQAVQAAKTFSYQPGKRNGKSIPVMSLTKRATSQEPADKTTAGVD